jgi:hypothetical protein
LQAEGTATISLVSEALQTVVPESGEKLTANDEDVIMQVAMIMYNGGLIDILLNLNAVLTLILRHI